MGWGDGGAERAGRLVANFFDAVNTARWTRWNFAIFVEFDVRRQVVRKVDGLTIGLAFFQSEFLGRGINLTKIVDAGVCWTCSTLISNLVEVEN